MTRACASPCAVQRGLHGAAAAALHLLFHAEASHRERRTPPALTLPRPAPAPRRVAPTHLVRYVVSCAAQNLGGAYAKAVIFVQAVNMTGLLLSESR